MLSSKRAPFGAILVVCLVATRTASGETYDEPFQEVVIHCEEALARLVDCCPGFDTSRLICNFRHSGEGGCGDGWRDDEDPALTLAESTCIRDRSCDDLRTSNVCSRAAKATPYRTKLRFIDGGTVDEGSSTHEPVCP